METTTVLALVGIAVVIAVVILALRKSASQDMSQDFYYNDSACIDSCKPVSTETTAMATETNVGAAVSVTPEVKVAKVKKPRATKLEKSTAAPVDKPAKKKRAPRKPKNVTVQ